MTMKSLFFAVAVIERENGIKPDSKNYDSSDNNVHNFKYKNEFLDDKQILHNLYQLFYILFVLY